MQMLPPVKRITDQVLADLGIPRSVLVYINYPTSFDSTNTQQALEGTDISVPPLPSYADRLWDYWERNLDPDLFKDRSLSGAIGGKTVMITGASSGIGKAAAIKAAEAGAKVLLVARTPEKLEETKDEIEEAGGEAHIHRADLSDIEDVERMAEEVLAEHGKVDILVNNAGRSIRRSIALSYDRFHDFERTMQLNYFGSLKLILSLLPAMRKTAQGPQEGRAHHQRQLDRGADQHPALLGLRRLEGGARRLVALRRQRDGGRQRQHHHDPHAAGADADDRPDQDVRRLPDDHARGGRGHDLRRDDPQAEEGRDPPRQLRRAALHRRAEGLGRDPQHRLQAVPRVEGGQGRGQEEGRRQGRQGRGALDRGRRLRLPDARGPLVDLARRRRALALLALALVLAMSTWFSAAAVLPQLRADWELSSGESAWLTIAVQLGFVAGARRRGAAEPLRRAPRRSG